jgi:hypothetical protein
VQGGPGKASVTHRLRRPDEPPRPLAGFSRTLVVLLGIIGALYAIEFLVELGYIGVLQDRLDGNASVQDVEDIRAASAGVQVLSGVLSLVAAGFFIAWTYRAYENLDRTSVAGLRYDAKWAIAAWFIPVAWWIRPKQMLNDVWRAGEPGIEVRNASWQARPVSPLLHWWWALWVAAALIGIAAGVVGFDPDGVLSGRAEYEREQEAATVAAPGILCTAFAAILACLVVRRITDRGERLRAAVLSELPKATPAVPAADASASAREGIADGSRLRCPLCGWVFREPQSLRDHLARHHPEHAEGGAS